MPHREKMKRIGLTGGIGSGKTMISTLLGIMGVPVYDSDERAKALYDEDESLKTSMMARFGETMFTEGRLDRGKLAEVIFKDCKALSDVNAMVHPVVEADFKKWMQTCKSPFVVQESAILFEAGMAPYCDMIVVVTAPEELRIKRVCMRNGCSPESVCERIIRQLPEYERLAMADRVLVNDDVHPLIPQVQQLLASIQESIVNC